MRFRLLPILPMMLAACGVPGQDGMSGRTALPTTELPPMRVFAPTPAARPVGSNADLARDFLELSFSLESGRALPVFTRFEGPVTLRLTGEQQPSRIEADLGALLDRLRREARIDITRVAATEPANITVETVPRRQLQRVVPQAACFVVPNATDWESFRATRRSRAYDWSRVTTRTRAAIFLPGDVSPQELRDCLHEEIAQALGPLNDLFRLTNSVFNDDNFHAVLTGFDMLMLRATYASELSSGMTKAEVARRLPAIFARMNPAGRRGGVSAPLDTPRSWIDQIETALAPNIGRARRLRAAERAVVISDIRGWDDTRAAFSHFILARLSLGTNGDTSFDAFLSAAQLYSIAPNADIQSAHVGMHMAAFSLAAGKPETTLEVLDAHIPSARRAENAALLATFLFMRAEALEMLGNTDEANSARTEGIGWGRYGFEDREVILQRMREIASLVPRDKGNTS